MNNPYKVLGVPENATDEEIKKAYRELVKKYHPDKYSDSDLADLAKEKMQQVNAAYDEIQKIRKAHGSTGTSSNGYGYSNTNSGNYTYVSVRQYINARNFSAAYSMLNGISTADRGAEWNFLMGCTLMGMGRIFDARAYLDRACSIDPSNLEYRAARDRAAGVTFSSGGFGASHTNAQGCGCSNCDMCTSLLCADCLCECCGGDLISCC